MSRNCCEKIAKKGNISHTPIIYSNAEYSLVWQTGNYE